MRTLASIRPAALEEKTLESLKLSDLRESDL